MSVVIATHWLAESSADFLLGAVDVLRPGRMRQRGELWLGSLSVPTPEGGDQLRFPLLLQAGSRGREGRARRGGTATSSNRTSQLLTLAVQTNNLFSLCRRSGQFRIDIRWGKRFRRFADWGRWSTGAGLKIVAITDYCWGRQSVHRSTDSPESFCIQMIIGLEMLHCAGDLKAKDEVVLNVPAVFSILKKKKKYSKNHIKPFALFFHLYLIDFLLNVQHNIYKSVIQVQKTRCEWRLGRFHGFSHSVSTK